MGMISEFKEFAMKGNLVDMAVGFVLGAAFSTVVTSFINDIFMPAISPIMGGVNLGDLKYVVSPAQVDAEGNITVAEVAINYGHFINTLISFLIVAFVMYMIVKGMNKAMKKVEEEPVTPAEEVLLAEIRDLLKR